MSAIFDVGDWVSVATGVGDPLRLARVMKVVATGTYVVEYTGGRTETIGTWDMTPTSAPETMAEAERREVSPRLVAAGQSFGQAGKFDMAEHMRESNASNDRIDEDWTGQVLDRLGSKDRETPARFLRAMRDLTCGERDEVNVGELLRTFPLAEGSDPGVVVVRSIPFASVCAHHALPFSGLVDVAYIPSTVIVGLSKIPRLVRHMSRRFSVQEGIGELVADAMNEHLMPYGVLVRITARHSCMALRGAESPGEMVTCCVRGAFRDDPSARAEALALIG